MCECLPEPVSHFIGFHREVTHVPASSASRTHIVTMGQAAFDERFGEPDLNGALSGY